MFMIHYFWRIYKLKADRKCKRGEHFVVGVWKTPRQFCLHCMVDLPDREIDGNISTS